MVVVLCKYVVQCIGIYCSHHVNWNSMTYRKGTLQTTEIERAFLFAKVFNTNLVQFLNFYCRIMLLLLMCISALLHARFPMCTDRHLKWFCVMKAWWHCSFCLMFQKTKTLSANQFFVMALNYVRATFKGIIVLLQRYLKIKLMNDAKYIK